MVMKKHNVKNYSDILSVYKEEDYFVQSTILINYIPSYPGIIAGNDNYIITDIELLSTNDSDDAVKIRDLISRCNKLINRRSRYYSWQVFYAFKEIIKTLTNDLKFNYFRGQSDDFPLLPGALRYANDSVYIENFETIYRKLAYEFPNKINYVPIGDNSKLVERESNLSVLQHYGLKTALLDITKNPYIAMMFMLKETIKEYKRPTLYLFKINDTDIEKSSLFSEVRKSNVNERIIAQKGAFLNFEKILGGSIKEPISYVKLVLNFDDHDYNNYMRFGFRNPDKHYNNNDDIKNMFNKMFIDEDKIKIYCLGKINDELEKILKEYYYYKEDMFPDFENKIKYLSSMYSEADIKNKSFNDIVKTKKK